MKVGGRVMTFAWAACSQDKTVTGIGEMPTKSGVARRGLQGPCRDHVEPRKESAK